VNPDDNDAWDLATLAAQLLRRRNTESDAVDAAWALVEAAKEKLEEIRLRAEWPEEQARLEKQQAEYLDSREIPYDKGVKLITSQSRWSYAQDWFKRFVSAKAKERGEQTEEGVAAHAGAMLAKYRSRGFTGTEAKKLREEFEQWRGKGRQGRVKKRASDGRLRENRQKKLQKQGKEAMAELTNQKVEWRTKHYQASVLKGARGKKGRTYQGSADNMRDTPKGQGI
jgi:hypothetical protein